MEDLLFFKCSFNKNKTMLILNNTQQNKSQRNNRNTTTTKTLRKEKKLCDRKKKKHLNHNATTTNNSKQQHQQITATASDHLWSVFLKVGIWKDLPARCIDEINSTDHNVARKSKPKWKWKIENAKTKKIWE